MEEAWIQSAPTTASPASATAPTMVDRAPTTLASLSAMPTTHRPLPRYKGRQINNTDLLDSIDRVGAKLAETLALVSLIQSQPNEQVNTNHNRSTRPARASRPTRLGTDLMVTSTPKGRSVRRRPAPRWVSSSPSAKPQWRTTRLSPTACETLLPTTCTIYNAAQICVLYIDLD